MGVLIRRALLVGGARADRLAISARFKDFSWFVAFAADPSKHRPAVGRQRTHAEPQYGLCGRSGS